MKLGKDEIQKMVLGGLLLLGLIYGYFSMLLGPLGARQEVAKKNAQALEPEIAAAQQQIAKTQSLEAAAPIASGTVQQLGTLIPEGSPVAWFPPRMSDFFKKHGIDKVATRMNSESNEKDMVGFRRIAWSVDLPKVNFMPFAAAIAQLENEDLLLEISSLQIDSNREEPGAQHVLLTVRNLVK